MKKFTALIISILTANACMAYSLNGFSETFARKFKNCDVYFEKADFHANGTVFHDKKHIEGWQGETCHYRQIIQTTGSTVFVNCHFSVQQVNTLYNALLIQPKQFGVDNRTQQIWDRYVLDKKNCTITGNSSHSIGPKADKKYLPNF